MVVYTKHAMATNKFIEIDSKVRNQLKSLNNRRDPSANVFIVVGLVFIGGFMLYNFIGNQLTLVESRTYKPVAVTPIPTATSTPTPTPDGSFRGE